MLYLLAIILPPVAVLIAGKPFQALINVGLCILLIIPGIIHALLVVHNHYADKRANRIVDAMHSDR
ncbi:MAG: YqaE/Pmp3 family membrane protein [Dehalococcoidia bacterium]|nr:YqaE/Pmp3 family membrane protein [Dehalococcoidia bacterium]